MPMLCFKCRQNRTVIEQFDFFEGGGGGGEGGGLEGGATSFINFNLNYYWYTYKTVLFQISAKSQYK